MASPGATSLRQHCSRVVDDRKNATSITVVLAIPHSLYCLFQLEQILLCSWDVA